jgi:Transposase IS200 like.
MVSKHNSYLHRRHSIRLRGYDYSQPGAYFVTICTQNHESLLGEIVDEKMRLNTFGRIVEHEWLRTPILRPNVVLDVFVVMPNHFHAIVMITDNGRGVSQYAPTANQPPLRSPSQTIGAIVRGFKSVTTKRINQTRQMSDAQVWQRNYYEHIIRGEEEANRIRQYVVHNPNCWAEDKDNPARLEAIIRQSLKELRHGQ